jgi:geranylgeranyl pyrophosphate synthase
MGQLRKNLNEIINTVLEIHQSNYGVCFQTKEIIEKLEHLELKDVRVSQSIISALDEDTSHNNESDIHTMNLLYSSLKDQVSPQDVEFMKILQGLEQQTILIDDVIDNPESTNKSLKTSNGFIFYHFLNENFYNALNNSNKFDNGERMDIIKEWNLLGLNIYYGQTKDLLNQNSSKLITLKEYYETIRLTTASFTEFCIYLSAKTSKFDSKTTNKLKEVGKYIGFAFQIRDDYHDLEKDFIEGKQRIFSVSECPKGISEMAYLSSSVNEKIALAKQKESVGFVKQENLMNLQKARKILNESNLLYDAKERLNYICDLIKI